MKNFVGFEEARDLILSHVQVIGTETLPLGRSTGRFLAQEILSRVDSPSTDASRMDGFAVSSEDLRGASASHPVRLKVTGHMTAGSSPRGLLEAGQAVGVTTGAPVPTGADAVLPVEFCEVGEGVVTSARRASPGENILRRGTDIQTGEKVASRGEQLSPPLLGLVATSGWAEVEVYRPPRVAVIGTGDEVVAPGEPLGEGKLYASNLVELSSWLSLMGLTFQTALVGDREGDIESVILRHLPEVDAFITSGGAWGSERDLTLRVLEKLNWQGIFHRVRMAPGKSTGFGLLEKKPVFCLPGAPTSNEIAFLQLALPGLLGMEGCRHPFFPVITARLTEPVRGKSDWTQFVNARLVGGGEYLQALPLRQRSRLQAMARKEALILIPEGRGELAEGESVDIQLLTPFVPDMGSPLGS